MLKKIIQTALVIFMPHLVALNPDINNVLPDSYPEVYDIEVLPYLPHGWYPHAPRFAHLIPKHNVKNVIEVGSWLGASTCHIASLIPENGTIYAVDHWLGSVDHLLMDCRDLLPTLFQQFLSNVVYLNLCSKVVPVRMPSLDAAVALKGLDLDIDMIYIDGAHDYEAVYKDLCAWYPFLKKGGIMTGDDFHSGDVQKAVYQFAKENKLEIYFDDNFWMYLPK